MTNAEQILLNVGVLSAVLTLTVTAGIFVTVLLGLLGASHHHNDWPALPLDACPPPEPGR